MNRNQRLWATFRGEKVDRTPVSFYELNGYEEDRSDADPFNIFSDESWRDMLELTRQQTDRIILKHIPFSGGDDPLMKLTQVEEYYDDAGSLHKITRIKAKDRTLTQHTRRDLDVNTIWTLEHFLKDEEDIAAYLDLPHDNQVKGADIQEFLKAEQDIGDTGLVALDTGDALLEAASLFSMEEYTIFAMTEPELFSELMDLCQQKVLNRTKLVSKLLPNNLWRIYGPEYATPPYLPPYLYEKYVVNYDRELIKIIKDNGGLARIHQHGNSTAVLRMTLETGCDGLDPIEPSPQGDITLKEARKICGEDFVLFGNLEINDIEMCDADLVEEKVKIALSEGPNSNGSAFVLMPSASPYGRNLNPKTVDNYRRILETVEKFGYRN